jgi:hypothetical protein
MCSESWIFIAPTYFLTLATYYKRYSSLELTLSPPLVAQERGQAPSGPSRVHDVGIAILSESPIKMQSLQMPETNVSSTMVRGVPQKHFMVRY